MIRTKQKLVLHVTSFLYRTWAGSAATRPTPELSIIGKDNCSERHNSLVLDKPHSFRRWTITAMLCWWVDLRITCSTLCVSECSRGAGDRRETPSARRRGALQEMALTLHRVPHVSLPLLSLLRLWLFMSARALEMIDLDAPELTCSKVTRPWSKQHPGFGWSVCTSHQPLCSAPTKNVQKTR